MKKGIVMEINDTCLTLLTPDGQFLQTKKQEHPYILGEEILFTPIAQKKFVNRFLGIKQLSIAAAALFLFAGSLIPVYESNKAYAYMSIDVNPSIELGINKQMQVVKVTAFNSDGKKIMSHIKGWEKKSITNFTQNVLKEMKKEGYLNNHHSMVISTVRTENPEENTEKQLSENMSQIKEMAQKNNLQVTVINGTEKEMEKAHELGLTMGKYKESKLQSLKKKNTEQPAKNEQDNGGSGVIGSSPNAAVNQEEIESANTIAPAPAPAPAQNNSSINQGNNNQNSIPPGQLKKAEETATVQSNQSQQNAKNEYKSEKKSSPINRGQLKNKSQSGQNKQSQEKSKK